MFWIRYRNPQNELVETSLSPTPTEVEYPEGDPITVQTTQDGRAIIQRPLMDGRPRKWIWKGYGPNHATFAALWTLLQSLKSSKLRGTIEVWEDVTGAGGFDALNGDASKKYTTVRLAQLDRKPAGAGPVFYEAAATFYIEDADYGRS